MGCLKRGEGVFSISLVQGNDLIWSTTGTTGQIFETSQNFVVLKYFCKITSLFRTTDETFSNISILLQILPAQAQDLAPLSNFSHIGLSSPFFFLSTPLVCLSVLGKQACSQSFFFHHENTMVLVGSVGC